MAKKEGNWRTLLKKLSSHIEELHHIATHDEKTGLYNSLFFKDFFEEETKRVKRKGGRFSLLIIDIDYFKKVNDIHGHLVGDKILKKIAEVLHHALRDYDILARFGGEEFITLLPDTGIDQANRIAERLRISVLQNDFLYKHKITISIGVAEYNEKDTYQKLLHRADNALYKAKKLGRNKVIAIA